MSNRKSRRGFSLIEVIIVVVIVGLLAALGIPAFQKLEINNRNKTILKNLRTIAASGKQYILENGVSEIDYLSLIPTYLPQISPVAGENYDELVVSGTGGILEITQSDGTTKAYAY